MGPPRAKDEFPFESLFVILPFWTDVANSALPVAPVCMMLLNCWWVTREIEASAARVAHITFDHETQSVTWLLPASKRDLFAVGEARTHGCGCTTGSRHPACPYHMFVDYFRVPAAKFGEDFDSIHRNLPLFPSSLGATLLKKHVIEAYRTVIKKAGVATTKVDALGVTRQRFGGHVCRVVGAVWLYQTLGELYLVQLFARWGSQAITRYVQNSPLRQQSSFAARALTNFSAEQVRQSLHKEHASPGSITEYMALRTVVAQLPPALTEDKSELWKAMEHRVARLEGSVGERAACVRNLASPKSLDGCVHLIDLSGGGVVAKCGWKFQERAHIRLALEVAQHLPQEQRCEVCWPAASSTSSVCTDSEDSGIQPSEAPGSDGTSSASTVS